MNNPHLDADFSQPLACHVCGAPIEDETQAKCDVFMARWFCVECATDNPESAEHAPMSSFAAGLFAAFTPAPELSRCDYCDQPYEHKPGYGGKPICNACFCG